MKPVLFLALKDLRLLVRDKLALFWMLALPLIFALFFGSIMGGSGPGGTGAMTVAIVDKDGSKTALAFRKKLESSSALKIKSMELEPAREAVRRGELTAFLVVEKGFGDNMAFFGGGGGKQQAKLQVGIDPSRSAEKGYLQGLLMEANFAVMQQRFTDQTWMREQNQKLLDEIDKEPGEIPIGKEALKQFLGSLDKFLADAKPEEFKEGGGGFQAAMIDELPVARDRSGKPASAYEVSFPSSIMWGVLGCVTSFAVSLVVERTEGTLLRLQVAPISRAQVLAGKSLACFLSCSAICTLLLLLGKVAFGVRIVNPWSLAAAIACTSACFTGITMLLSTLGKTEQAVAGSGWGVLLPLSMIGGSMVPLIAMPKWMLALSDYSPVKWGILSMEGAIWRDFSPREMLFPCGVLLAIGAVSFVVGTWILRRTEG